MSSAVGTNDGTEESSSLIPAAENSLNRSESLSAQEQGVSFLFCHLGTDAIFRFSLLIVAVALGLISGNLYGFGRYASTLREVIHASQPQVQSLGIWMDIGNYLGHPITGWIYDRFGPSFSCLAAAVILTVSYSTIQYCVDDASSGESNGFHLWWQLTAAFAGVGFGSGLGYISGLGTVSKQFAGAWAVGLVAAGYGLSSTLVAWTYRLFGLSYMFATWALLVGVTNSVGALAFTCSIREQKQDDECDLSDEVTLPDDNQTNHRSLESNRAGDHTPWTTWKHCHFWLLFLSFASVTGCGLFVINNVSSIVQSRGLSDSFAGSLVVFLSASNVSGRVVVGLLVKENENLMYLRGAALLMTIGLSTSALLEGTTPIVCTVGCVAAAYGASWVLLVGVLKEWYGKEHFGKDYGVIAMGPALSGLVFNSLSAAFYEQHVVGVSGVCFGPWCFRRAFTITATAALIGCLFLSSLISARRFEASDHNRSYNRDSIGIR